MTSAELLLSALVQQLSVLFEEPVEIVDLSPLSGGASRETWSFDARTSGGRSLSLILRQDPLTDSRPEVMRREAEILATVHEMGVLVPIVYDHGDVAGRLDMPSAFLIMERIAGETIARRILRDATYDRARETLVADWARQLAMIHSVPISELTELPEWIDPVRMLQELYGSLGEIRPVVELGLAWLNKSKPELVTDVLVHGDFRLGNFIIDSDGLRAILDWELVHRGDPAEDLGWLCVKAWRFGSPHAVAGIGTRADLLDAYSAGGGTPISLDRLHWWEVYGTLRWAIMCRMQSLRPTASPSQGLESAALGRRVCEQEHDVLLALGHTSPRQVADVLEDENFRHPPGSPDSPNIDELLHSVEIYLGELASLSGNQANRFHSLVARNVLRIVRREVRMDDHFRDAHASRLLGLSLASDKELGLAIRHGQLSGPHLEEAIAILREQVTHRLAIANPSYVSQTS